MPSNARPLRDHVERGDGLGQQGRLAVRHAGHQRSEADPLGACGERAEQRVGLEHLLVGVAEHRQLEEVVHHEHRVESRLLGGDRLGGDALEQLRRIDARIGEVRDLEPEAGAVHGRQSRSSNVSMIVPGRSIFR